MMGESKEPTNILVVDDDNVIRLLINNMLKRQGFNLTQASSGEEAISKLADNSYELVITDLQMYGKSGLDVLKAAKASNPFTEVLILTGYGDIKTAVKAIKLGAYEYLSKPLNTDEFRMKVLKALEQRKLRLQIAQQERELKEFNEMISRDLKLAGQVQKTLVPPELNNDRVDVAVGHFPMLEIGGDFADVYFDHQKFLYLTMVDVTGHGVAAALIVNRLSNQIHRLVRDGLSPAELIAFLNDFVVAALAQTGLFLTMFCIQVDIEKNTLYYSGAAHPAAAYWSAGSRKLRRLYSQNTIVGFQKSRQINFTQDSFSPSSGDKIVLYTDGIVEAEDRRGKAFGVEPFFDMLQQYIDLSPKDITQKIITEVQAYCDGVPKDDIYIMVAEIK